MDTYMLWTGAIAAFLGILLTIKKLFGENIQEALETRVKRKELFTKVSEMSKTVENLTQVASAYNCDKVHFDQIVEKTYQQDEAIKMLAKTTQDMQLGIQATIRNDLLCLIKQHLSRGEITITDKENLDKLYHAYKVNGGNSFIDELMLKVNELPLIAE